MIKTHTVEIELTLGEVLGPVIGHLHSLGNISDLKITSRNGDSISLPHYNLQEAGILSCKIIKYESGIKVPDAVKNTQTEDARRIELKL